MTVTTENIEELIGILPGYDPYAQAGDCTFDEDAAQLVIEFIETMCTHVEGELGEQPFLLEDWQKAFFGNLFGWKHPNGLRRYREALLYIPRGNGKTAIAACLVIVMLYLDDEKGAKLVSAASETDQARLCFDVVQSMIRQNPSLESLAELWKYSTVVGDKSYRSLTSEAGSKHGKNLQLAVIDELHAHKDSGLVEALETGAGKRNQPLIVHLTTADYDRESICNQKYDYACKVRDGIIEDPAFLPAIYEAKSEDDWTDPTVWQKANPNLGISVPLDYMERKCKQAQDAPAFENTFKRLHLDIRTKTDVRWLKSEVWDKCDIVHRDTLKGRTCFGGLDLASCRDLTAFILSFPNDDGTHTIIPTFWIPEDIIRERSKVDGVNYDVWVREGWMRTTPGNATDYKKVRSDIDELGNLYGIQKIAVDRLFQGEETAHELGNMGFDVVAFGQGFLSMAAPTKRFDELYHAGQLKHDGNPVMRWMIHNVSIEIDAAGNMKPSKKKSSEKIDGVVGELMALGISMTADDATSIYDTRGVLTL